jgi:cytochrome c2
MGATTFARWQQGAGGNPKADEKIFKTKCAQCHTVDKGISHKQEQAIFHTSFIFGRDL